MKIWFDTEFIEDGKTIDLLSIGAVRENGAMFYAESREADRSRASQWVRDNVIPHLCSNPENMEWRVDIASGFRKFAGNNPEFWAYHASYDWVALCQLYGTMMDLPKGWPMYCRDIKQLCDDLGNPKLAKQDDEHSALGDAMWNRDMWTFLQSLKK